ncbi:SphA family protein [Methylobacter tundripaludum]
MPLKCPPSLTQFMATSFLVVTPLTQAAEGGGSEYLPGFYGDFGMAVTPESGYYLSNFLGYSTADDGNAGNSLLFELPGVMAVTDTKIAGGTYWFGFYPYVLRTESNSTLPDGTKIQAAHGGAGDMYAVPAQLSWQWDTVSLAVFNGIVLPTGEYDKDRSLNGGRNYWTFDNNIALTWLPFDGAYDLSLDFGYMVNTENEATHYRTGDELHLDYLAGYAISKSVSVGVAGSYYRQVTPDTGSGVPVDAIQGEYSSIGPAMMYNVQLGEQTVCFSAKWLREYNVNNHIPSDYVIVRTVLKF